MYVSSVALPVKGTKGIHKSRIAAVVSMYPCVYIGEGGGQREENDMKLTSERYLSQITLNKFFDTIKVDF